MCKERLGSALAIQDRMGGLPEPRSAPCRSRSGQECIGEDPGVGEAAPHLLRPRAGFCVSQALKHLL